MHCQDCSKADNTKLALPEFFARGGRWDLTRKQLKEVEGLLNIQKIRKTGERVALKGKFVFGTQEVHKLVEEAEAETARKQSRKQPRKRESSGKVVIENDEVAEELSSASDSDYIVVVVR